MNKLSLFVIYFSIYLATCPVSYARLSEAQTAMLDEALKKGRLVGTIHSEDDQWQAIESAGGFLAKEAPLMKLPRSEYAMWFRVFTHVSAGTIPERPKLEKDETRTEFEERCAKAHAQLVLQSHLTHYLEARFPISPDNSIVLAVGGAPAPDVEFKRLEVNGEAVSDPRGADQKQGDSAPVITASDIFAKYFGSSNYEGYSVHMEQLQYFREDAGGDGSRGKIITAFIDSLLGRTPLYPLNPAPVVLTHSAASQEFFQGLPKDMMETIGEWEGFRYDFIPSSLIYTGEYTDPASKAPIPLFFMRKKIKDNVGVEQSVSASNRDLESGKLEARARENLRMNDLLQAALKLRQGAPWDVPLTEAVERYLVSHPELGEPEPRWYHLPFWRARMAPNEMDRLERSYQGKLKEYEAKEKETRAMLIKKYFPQGELVIADVNERSRLHKAIIEDINQIMSSSTIDLQELGHALVDLRRKRIDNKFPHVEPMDLALKLLIALAEPEMGHRLGSEMPRGLARAQYELAKMRSEGEADDVDLEKAIEYAALAVSQGFPAVDFRPGKTTVTRVKYVLELNHPILGKAWEDPRGLKWSDQAVRDERGQIKKMNWEQAKDHCLNLNVDPGQRARVIEQLGNREAVLGPLRNFYNSLPYEQMTIEAGKYMRDKSQEFGRIDGCYLPNWEELNQQAIDKGYSWPLSDNRYKDNIFSDSEGEFWSSSENNESAYPGYAIAFRCSDGFAGGGLRADLFRAVRCVCAQAPR